MLSVVTVLLALMMGSTAGVPLGEGLHSPDRALTRLAFGSCSKHDRPQPLWAPISAFHPELWIWLGTLSLSLSRDPSSDDFFSSVHHSSFFFPIFYHCGH
jgi:hypothetical protein